ncbi:MAG: hypothetical protein COA86_09575 [Kangiella sp.]|nr:MAG: hypothetical protein COA86_09575 [Kangiella sp.]
MEIEYDSRKAESNLSKHGISFEEATTVLYDSAGLAQEDVDSTDEYRWVLVGLSSKANLLTVIYTIKDERIIRLISARKATRKEARYYAE